MLSILRRHTLALAALGLLLLPAACRDDGPTDPEDLTFASSLGVNLRSMVRSPTGLYLQDEVQGNGAIATPNDSVTVDYTGWLHDGQQFDSSTGRGPLSISRLGARQVVDGFDEGILGMRVGGRRLLVIPSHLAYGADGAGNGRIPPHATLVFRVELRTVTPR